LLVPILAGGDDIMRGIARRIVATGFHAAWCDRVAAALCPPQRGADLERLFERTVLHQRALLAWLRPGPIPAPPATFGLGVSIGGMIAAVLAAVDPDLDGLAICLAGADLPAIVLDSDESRVVHWRQWRMTTDGIGTATLRQELQQTLLSDPARLAPFAATERILLVHATLDEVVRPPHQDLLWEALGRPRRILIPLGHYTSALAIASTIAWVTPFFGERHPAVPVARACPEPAAGGLGRDRFSGSAPRLRVGRMAPTVRSPGRSAAPALPPRDEEIPPGGPAAPCASWPPSVSSSLPSSPLPPTNGPSLLP